MRILIAAILAIAASAGTASAQDAAKGGQVFAEMCQPCHRIGPGAQNLLGPELNGLDGRHTGSVPGYNYSDANKKSGIVWGEASFKKYIQDPQATIPGTKMYFAGIQNQTEINDLWAYLRGFNADGSAKKK
jgi:cytochrome c